MPTITSVTPGHATRGATGTLITIAGTGFGALQGGSTITIGAVAAIVAAWGDTEITCRADDSPATPLGAQDVVVTVSGVAATAARAVIVYDSTSTDSNSEVLTGKVSAVYIDGTHVGEIVGEPTIGAVQEALLPFNPQDRNTPPFQRVLTKSCPVGLTLAQINAANLALALGGSYDAGSQVITITGANANKSEHDLLIVLASGVTYTFPRVLVTSFAALALAADAWQGLPIGFTAYPTDDANLDLFQTYFPA